MNVAGTSAGNVGKAGNVGNLGNAGNVGNVGNVGNAMSLRNVSGFLLKLKLSREARRR